MKKRVADILIETLAECGVEQAFCVVGGGAMHLNNALATTQKLNVVFNHHEQAAAMACEGYARTEDKVALCLVTSGPGGTNAITGVMGAYQDSIPMIVVSGQVRYATTVEYSGLNLRRRGEQEFDIVNSVKNMTKYAKMITDPLSIKQEVCKAYNIATTGRRGPVWLDIPLDVQFAQVEESDLLPILPDIPPIECSENDFNELADMLSAAKAPLILAGSAIAATHSHDLLREALLNWRIPTVSASLITDNLACEESLYFGTTGGIGTRCGNYLISNADVLLVIGCSMGYKQTTFMQEVFAPQARIIMVDVNPDEAKKPGLNISKFIHSDLQMLLNRIKNARPISAPQNWLSYCLKLKNKFDIFENATGKPEERVNSYNFWKEYYEQAPADTITVLGNNTGIAPMIQAGKKLPTQRIMANYNCGSMGWDVPAAIGASLSCAHEVVLATGDGSIMMNLQELHTIVSNNIPVKVIVFSNGGYGAIVQTCRNYFNGLNVGCNPESGLTMPNFEKLATSFGFRYHKCQNNSEIKDSINWLFNQIGCCFLELLQSYDNPASPVLKAKMTTDGQPQQLQYEIMSPFISDEEHLDCIFSAEG